MPAPSAEFGIETLAEVLVETRAMRRALRVHGVDTPGLDAEIAALEAAIVTARTDCHSRDLPSPSASSGRILGRAADRETDSVRRPPTDGGTVKLTPQDVAKIRHLGTFARAGITTQRAIAANLGLSQSTVCDVLTGKLHPRPEPTEWRPQVRLVDLRVAPAEPCEVTPATAHDSPSLAEGDPEALDRNNDEAAAQ
jgi:hypothetical protein